METEMLIRVGVFLGVFAVLATAEFLAPRRRLSTSKARRWFANLAIIALNPLSVFLLFPILPVGLALFASEHNWGLLNHLALPEWLKVIAAVALLDLVVYMQHVLFHAIPTLWRLHMMHHADMDIDMTKTSIIKPQGNYEKINLDETGVEGELLKKVAGKSKSTFYYSTLKSK